MQPIWKFIANLGDASPLDYGGAFVFEDTTGVYAPELELLELDNPDNEESAYTVSRILLEKCTLTDGILSANKYHPLHAEWFADKIGAVADCCGLSAEELQAKLCAEDSIERATGYLSLIAYFGAFEFDEYPLQLSRAEARNRYCDILNKFGTVRKEVAK